MDVLFRGVCGLSLVFFGYFFLACQRDASRRNPSTSSVVKISPEVQAIDSPRGRRYLIRLEEQMADFLKNHRSASAADRSRITPLGPVVRP